MSFDHSFACTVARTRAGLRWVIRFYPRASLTACVFAVCIAALLLVQMTLEYQQLQEALARKRELTQTLLKLGSSESVTRLRSTPNDSSSTSLNEVLASLAKPRDGGSVVFSEVEMQSSSASDVFRHDIRMRVNGPFMSIYAWISELLIRHPALALESIDVRRDNPETPVVDARLAFILFTDR